MTLNLNEKQVVILKSLLSTEIEYLEETIKEESGEDKKGLIEELNSCKDLLNQLK